MPSLQEVEQFKAILNELGDEPEILVERGEEIEDVSPPEQGLPEGLSDLLEGEAAGPEIPGPEAEEAPVEPFPAETAEAVPPPEEEAIDLSDLFGEEEISGAEILEGLELPAEEVPAEAEAPPSEAEIPLEAEAEAPAPEAEIPPAEEALAFELEEAAAEAPAPEAEPEPTPAEEIPIEGFELPEEFALEEAGG